MKYLLFLLIFILTSCSVSAPSIPEDVLADLQSSSQTMFNMSGEINSSLANLLDTHVKNKKPGDTVLVYINSNGGDVAAAEKIMNSLVRHKSICVADMALSAAFEIFQSCTVRIYLDRTLLMVHRHSISFESNLLPVPDIFFNGLDAYIQETYLLTKSAHRMKITYNELIEKIEKNNGEWYLYGKDIMQYNAADYYIKDYQIKKNK